MDNVIQGSSSSHQAQQQMVNEELARNRRGTTVLNRVGLFQSLSTSLARDDTDTPGTDTQSERESSGKKKRRKQAADDGADSNTGLIVMMMEEARRDREEQRRRDEDREHDRMMEQRRYESERLEERRRYDEERAQQRLEAQMMFGKLFGNLQH